MNTSSNTKKDFLASGIRAQAQALLRIEHTIETELTVPETHIKEELKLVEANVKRLRKNLLHN